MPYTRWTLCCGEKQTTFALVFTEKSAVDKAELSWVDRVGGG